MDREAAVRLAAGLVEEMGNSPERNGRGYKVDGWKPFTGPERAEAIVNIAATLIDPEPTVTKQTHTGTFQASLFGWSLYSNTSPTFDQYRLALDVRERAKGGILTNVEAAALNCLIAAYEADHPVPPPPPLPQPGPNG